MRMKEHELHDTTSHHQGEGFAYNFLDIIMTSIDIAGLLLRMLDFRVVTQQQRKRVKGILQSIAVSKRTTISHIYHTQSYKQEQNA